MKKLAIIITIAAASTLLPLMFLAVNGGNWSAFGTGYGLEALTVLYWLPTIIILSRRIPGAGPVIVTDALLGWTVIGWIVALAMACRSKPPAYPYPPAAWYPQQPPQGQLRRNSR